MIPLNLSFARAAIEKKQNKTSQGGNPKPSPVLSFLQLAHRSQRLCFHRLCSWKLFLSFLFSRCEIRSSQVWKVLAGVGMDWVGQQRLFLPWFALSPWSALDSWAGSWTGAEQTIWAIIALAPWLWFAIAAEQEDRFGWPWGRVLAVLLMVRIFPALLFPRVQTSIQTHSVGLLSAQKWECEAQNSLSHWKTWNDI